MVRKPCHDCLMNGKKAPGGKPPLPKANWRFNLWYVLFALIALAWTRDLWVSSRQVQPVAYSEFVQHLKEGRVESVTVGSKVLEGKLKAPLPDGRTRIVADARRAGPGRPAASSTACASTARSRTPS